MKLHTKLLLIVVGSIGVTTIPGVLLIQRFSYDRALRQESLAIEEEVLHTRQQMDRYFAATERKLASLRILIERELALPERPGEVEEFERRTELMEDGIIRSRRAGYEGEFEAGIFLPPFSGMGTRDKIELMRIKRILEMFGSAATRPHENAYYLTPRSGLILMDRAKPNYVFEMGADIDYASTPWVQMGDPETNPGRELWYTPLLFEPVYGTWMVSAILPVYSGDRWIGTVGDDLRLNEVFGNVFSASPRHPGERHFLRDREGHYILAGEWQEMLQNDYEGFLRRMEEERWLSGLLGRLGGPAVQNLGVVRAIRGRPYLAMGAVLEQTGWEYLRLVPLDEIQGEMRQLLRAVQWVMVLMALVMGLSIVATTLLGFSRRIRQLVLAMDELGGGRLEIPEALVRSNDEIGWAAKSFAHMAEELTQAGRELRESQGEIKQQNKLLNELLSHLHIGVFMVEAPSGKPIIANPEAQRLLGRGILPDVTKENLSEVYRAHKPGCTESYPAEEMPIVRGMYGETSHVDDMIVVRPDGKETWLEIFGAPIRNEQGRVWASLVSFHDITDRKRSEEALRANERRFSQLIQNSFDTFVILDADGIQRYVSESGEKMHGYPSAELVGIPVIEQMIHPDDQAQVMAAFRQIIETGEGGTQYRHRCKAGGWVWFEARGTNQLNNPDIRGVVVNVRDITERKRAEDEWEKLQGQLAQAQKMESVGRLAGGVAHDFNNMLGVIQGHVEMALEDLGENEPLRGDLQEIASAARRSADLTRQLLAFARKQTVVPKLLDLNECIEGMLKMLGRLIGEGIDLVWKPGAGLWSVKLDPAQMDQILVNLCVNARDAIDGIGKLTIETGNATVDAEFCAQHADAMAGDYVWLAVGDDGCGMSPEVVAHVFEPFFTTKAVGEGTGLGLATVYGAVKQNGGFIELESEEGKGTTFRIYFPRQKEHAEPLGSAEPQKAAVGSGTILLVEDEPAILRMTESILKRLGYEVVAAGSPAEAIRRAREYQGRLDLLLSDVVMPEMNGRELAQKLLEVQPGIRRLFMSGYPADVIAHQGLLEEGVEFIQKPFRFHELAKKIREVLG